MALSLALLVFGRAGLAAEIDVMPAPRLEVRLREKCAQADLIWIEGQAAVKSTAIRQGWYDGVRKDAMIVRLRVQGHVRDFYLPAFKSRDGEALLHDRACYTLNEIPKPQAN